MSFDEPEVWLFSYRTLRQPEVQVAIFRREVEGTSRHATRVCSITANHRPERRRHKRYL
jgi:hypothetical protein